MKYKFLLLRPLLLFVFLLLAKSGTCALPIDKFTKLPCDSLDAIVNKIFIQDLTESKETKENADALFKSIQLKDCNSLADMMNLIGLMCYNKNQPNEAKKYLLQADALLVENKKTKSPSFVRNKLYQGLTEQIGGNFKLAQIYFQKALDISQEIKFAKGILQAKLNLSLGLIKDAKLKEARKILLEAAQYSKAYKLLGGYVFQNLARTYMLEANHTEALNFTKKAEDVWTDLGFSKGLYFVNINLAEMKLAQSDTAAWKMHLEKALTLAETDESYTRHTVYYTLGLYHFERKADDEAIMYFQKALEQSASFEEKDIVTIIECLMTLYEKKGDITNIKNLTQEAVKFFDSKSTFFLNKAEKWEIKELRLENEIRENDYLRFRNETYRNTLIGTVIFFLIFGWMLMKYLKQSAEKKRLQDAQDFRTTVSSNLHDDVGSTLTALAMKTEILALSASPEDKAELDSISETSRAAMSSLRDTVWAIDARKDRYENLIDKMTAHGYEQLTYKNIQFIPDTDNAASKMYIQPAKRQNIFLIFKEAISNILKHSNATVVNLYMTQDEQLFKMVIKDNGTIESDSKTEGLGLANMKMRAEKIDATLTYNFDNGFNIFLEMPS